ncbi:MAG: hypothetical protein RL417_1967 [Pseudomonadota bacterium]
MLHSAVTRSHTVAPPSSLERRLERAREHVSRMWFPANPEILERIRSGLGSGAYELDIDFLLDEIRDDFALFTYCLKGLTRLLAQEKVEAPLDLSPVEVLRWAGLPRLKIILADSHDTLTFHNLRELSDFQAARLHEAIVSASTAEVLAEHSQLNAGTGYSAALLRQLGLTLIAWNYPALYRRSLAAQDPLGLDEVLARALGFSPALLGAAVMRDWPLQSDIQAAVFESSRSGRPNSPGRLEHICRIGEMLARANDPERHPTASTDWEQAQREIKSTLGADGLHLIQIRARAHGKHYSGLDIAALEDISAIDPARRVHGHSGSTLLRNNRHIRNCPPLLARKLRDLYGDIVPGRIDRANINTLVREIIPSAGFSAGTIFILDPVEPRLIPRLKFGEPGERALTSIPVSGATDIIMTAFQCRAPVQDSSMNGLAVVAGSLGGEHRAGVLYLEFPPILASGPRILTAFKAIRRALDDCLGL